MRKHPFSTVKQIKNTLPDVGIDVSNTSIKKKATPTAEDSPHHANCKPQEQNIQFAKKYISHHSSGTCASYRRMGQEPVPKVM